MVMFFHLNHFLGHIFFYSKEGNPTLDSNFNDSCKFTMQQHGYQFVLIDKDNRKLCSKTSDDTLFDLIRGPAGYYSLLSTNRAYISGDGFGKWVWATNDNNFIQDRSKLHVILHENNTSTEYPKIKLDRPLVPEYESTLYSFDYDPSEETTTQDNNFVEENTQETVEEPVKTTSKQQDNSGEEKKEKKKKKKKRKKKEAQEKEDNKKCDTCQGKTKDVYEHNVCGKRCGGCSERGTYDNGKKQCSPCKGTGWIVCTFCKGSGWKYPYKHGIK